LEPEPEPELSATVTRSLVVVRASGLRKADTFSGKSDPYAVISYEGARIGRTPVLQRTVCPFFNTQMALVLPRAGGGSLRVELLDEDALARDDFLGALELALPAPLPPAGVLDASYALAGPGGETESRGTVTLWLGEVGAEPPPEAPAPPVLRSLMLMRAVGLLSADTLSRKSDPYCVVYVDNEWAVGCRTATVANSLAPAWNEALRVAVPAEGCRLRVEVLDEDKGMRDDFLGQVQLESCCVVLCCVVFAH
jgi:Ca2+-dependent lipid-binding protein